MLLFGIRCGRMMLQAHLLPRMCMQAETDSRAKGSRQAEAGEEEVSDAELARRLGREDTAAKSMRMQKKARHK